MRTPAYVALVVIPKHNFSVFACFVRTSTRPPIYICTIVSLSGLCLCSQSSCIYAKQLYSYLCRSLNHHNILCLLGTIHRSHSIVLIMNFVRGKLHSIIFDSQNEVCLLMCEGYIYTQYTITYPPHFS